MFAKSIVLSDAFLGLPTDSRSLYLAMNMFADDDGFINGVKSIICLCGVKESALKKLLEKNFIIQLSHDIYVIKHWRINNYIRNDRYHETNYTEEKSLLDIKENGSYTLKDKSGIPSNGIPSTVDRDKDRLDKNSIGKVNNMGRFTPPTIEEVKAYCIERGNRVNPEQFVDFYSAKGWLVGKNKMKDWKAAVRTWERNSSNGTSKNRLDWIDEV